MTEVCRDIVGAVREHARTRPNQTAVTWLSELTAVGGALTYAQVDRAAGAVAAALLDRARPRDRVLLAHPPGLGFVTAFLGCLYAGCLPVPVYPLLDTPRAAETVRRILADSGAVLAWTGDEGMAALVEQTLGVPAAWRPLDEPYLPDTPPDPEAPAFLQYTSGSTADPKGVMVTHGNLAANLAAIATAFEHDRDAVVLSWLPAYHDMGLIGNILHPLHIGCRTYLASPLDFIRRPLAWPEAVARHGVTTSGAPNFAYELVAKAIDRHGTPDVDLSGWAKAYCGAEPVSEASLRRFAERLAPCGFRAGAFIPCYGLAEATLLVTSVPPRRGPRTAVSLDGRPAVSCGVPQGCEVAVADTEGRRLPDGRVGEIRVSGPGVAAGYWGRPRLTAEVFDGSVDGDGRRWLRTGDLGFLSDGELYVTGRIKDLIVVRGRNHHPQDLERLAAETLPGFRPGCVAAFEDAAGTGAVIVGELRDGHALRAADAERLASAVASEFGLRLTAVAGVPRGAVPKTTSGKLRRGECRDRFLAGDHDRSGTVVRTGGTERDAGTEPGSGIRHDDAHAATSGRRTAPPAGRADPAEAVRAAVREVVGGAVGEHEPLSAHGLDSLGAVRLAALLAEEAGLDLPVRDLLGEATLADLAGRARRAADGTGEPAASGTPVTSGTPATPGTPAASRASGRPSKAQEALLFLHMLNPEGDEYNISYAWETGPGTDPARFEEALRVALGHRPELAVRFTGGGPGLRREPVPAARIRDALALIPLPVAEDELGERLAAAAARPFRPDEGPLLRVHLWAAPGRRVYQLVVHHLVTDLWSIGLLMRDLRAAYEGLSAGRPLRLPPAGRYDDYVADQEEYLASPAAIERDAELRELLPRRARAVEIRTDRPRRGRRAARAGRVTRELAPEVAARLADRDPVALLTALWAVCLHRYGTPDPVVVGVPVTGRPYGRHAGIAGLCTNTVPLALRIEPERPLADLVHETRRRLLAGMDAGLYPLARAVEVVRPDREAGRVPLVETMVTVQENPLPEAPGMLAAMAGMAATIELGDLVLRHVPVPRTSCRYDLDLVITPLNGGYLLALDYAAELFTAETAGRILDTYAAMAAAAALDATGPVSGVMVLSEPDRELLDRAGRCDTPPLRPSALDRIRRIARESPDAPAVADTGGVLTFGEFAARVDGLAAALVRELDREDER